MKKLILLVSAMMMIAAIPALASDSSYFVCKVKTSTMKMYKKSDINVQLSNSLDYIRMDQGNRSLEAQSRSGNGALEITTQDMFQHDEWNSGKVYLSNSVIKGLGGTITIIDQFTDGNERTVLACGVSDEG